MALTNFVAFSPDASDDVVDSAIIGNDVAGGVVGASEATSVERTIVDIVGMTFAEVDAMLVCFNWIKLSNSFSVSLHCSFSFRAKYINSSCLVWFSMTSSVWGCCNWGIFNYFFSETISLFFFFISFSMAFISLGSCRGSIIKSSKDLILVSFACEEAFSN